MLSSSLHPSELVSLVNAGVAAELPIEEASEALSGPAGIKFSITAPIVGLKPSINLGLEGGLGKLSRLVLMSSSSQLERLLPL